MPTSLCPCPSAARPARAHGLSAASLMMPATPPPPQVCFDHTNFPISETAHGNSRRNPLSRGCGRRCRGVGGGGLCGGGASAAPRLGGGLLPDSTQLRVLPLTTPHVTVKPSQDNKDNRQKKKEGMASEGYEVECLVDGESRLEV